MVYANIKIFSLLEQDKCIVLPALCSKTRHERRGPSVFPQSLTVEDRVSLHYQAGPVVRDLEVKSVGVDLSVLATGLYEEPVLKFPSKDHLIDV